jgi:uncharacterized damage-inducible protein DinB
MTMATETITKQQLLENMRATGREFAQAARDLPADRWGEGRYEEGWTAKDILAHVASIEWTYPKLLDVASGAIPLPNKDASKGLPGDYNQRHVEKRRDNSIEELLEEFERNREATIAAVAEADDDLLRMHVRSAGGVEGAAVEVFNYLTVVHVGDHLRDIKGLS